MIMINLQMVHVGMTVADLERSATFYESLGFARETPIALTWADFWAPKNHFYHLPEGTNGTVLYMNGPEGMSIELFQFEGALPAECPVWNRPGIHHIAMRTTDLDALYNDLVARGCDIGLEPVKGKKQAFLFLRDPDGNLVEIAQPY